MHFDSSELKNFYFVNPQWLCNVFAHVVLSTDHCKLQPYRIVTKNTIICIQNVTVNDCKSLPSVHNISTPL